MMEALYERLRPALVGYARRGGHEDPEAFAQTVFTRALGSRYEDRGWSEDIWLWTIARNLMTDYRRHHRASFRDPDRKTFCLDCYPFEAEHVRRSIRALPERWRLVLFMRFFEDRPIAEVGRIMGMSQGAVKALRHRAIAGLRREMGA